MLWDLEDLYYKLYNFKYAIAFFTSVDVFFFRVTYIALKVAAQTMKINIFLQIVMLSL